MLEKKKIYYIDFVNIRESKRKRFFGKRFAITKDCKYGFEGIRISGRIDLLNDGSDRLLRKLTAALRNYDLSETVVMADCVTAEIIGISDMLFEAKKYELIHNCAFIMEQIHRRFSGRENAVIVLESDKWNVRDVFLILTVIKNYYRNIDVVAKYKTADLVRLTETVYDEWGMVLHIYSVNDYHGEDRDFALLLLTKWSMAWKKKIPFESAFLVTEEEYENKAENIYSGLVYMAGLVLPCALGRNIAWQKPVLYEKFHVSVIDICEIG